MQIKKKREIHEKVGKLRVQVNPRWESWSYGGVLSLYSVLTCQVVTVLFGSSCPKLGGTSIRVCYLGIV